MSSLVKRCPRAPCRRPVLVVERGTVYPVGGARIVESGPDKTLARCQCGALVEWDTRAAATR